MEFCVTKEVGNLHLFGTKNLEKTWNVGPKNLEKTWNLVFGKKWEP